MHMQNIFCTDHGTHFDSGINSERRLMNADWPIALTSPFRVVRIMSNVHCSHSIVIMVVIIRLQS